MFRTIVLSITMLTVIGCGHTIRDHKPVPRVPHQKVMPEPDIAFTTSSGVVVNTSFSLEAQMMSLARVAIDVQKNGAFADTCNPQVKIVDDPNMPIKPGSLEIRNRLGDRFRNEDITKAGNHPDNKRSYSYWTQENVYQARAALESWIKRRNSCNSYDRSLAHLGRQLFVLHK